MNDLDDLISRTKEATWEKFHVDEKDRALFDAWYAYGAAPRGSPRDVEDRRRILRPRWHAWLRANVGGYFWLPCPICGDKFSWRECGSTSLMVSAGSGLMVCERLSCEWEAQRRNDKKVDPRREMLAALRAALGGTE